MEVRRKNGLVQSVVFLYYTIYRLKNWKFFFSHFCHFRYIKIYSHEVEAQINTFTFVKRLRVLTSLQKDN